jgi:CDP-diacylglycerol--glycerol-3-phosphate 3-phosphatidyltransferase
VTPAGAHRREGQGAAAAATGALSRIPPPKPDVAGTAVSTEAPLLNPANVLTGVRLLIVPFFVWLLVGGIADNAARGNAAAALFVVASITDFLDGWYARKYDLVTTFGKVADPIADKALTGSALIGLSAGGELAWWVTVVILAREIGVTVLRFVVIKHGVIPASRGGKLKTVLQMIAITMYLLPLDGFAQTLASWIMGAALVVTVLTGIDYGARAISVRSRSKAAMAARANGTAGTAG